ncbi:hypothetical protein LPTSP2_37120 [Leptospira ellinghausenii]|uniref:TIR domain-containing protein n=1 Tax=Leptospira ellinghausenii TaxID=1917822 RepID=A0A2P2DII1_9LEPT|nr:hypothetical protein [Leptospira ellinghausenii]GBF44409.1 hypothetical protein LPTSP2_37120 [Leptospira ellinghausenii]
MTLLTESFLTEKADTLMSRDYRARIFSKSNLAKSILTESTEAFNAQTSYDIFLSHSYIDKILILGLKAFIEESGFSVYIDWIEDKQLERSLISSKTASVLRTRMNSCKVLFFATSENSTQSKWMPWECGYMDAKTNRVAICPIIKGQNHSFKGQEYLGLYPFVDYAPPKDTSTNIIWINDPNNSNYYSSLRNWIIDGKLNRHD